MKILQLGPPMSSENYSDGVQETPAHTRTVLTILHFLRAREMNRHSAHLESLVIAIEN